MPILDTLAVDHRVLEQTLDELSATPSTEPERRTEIFSRLQALLQAHSRAEEEVVYRPLKQAMPQESKTFEAYEEHHVADVLLQELASACPGGAGWSAKLRVFEELVRHHIKEEELQLFALISERMDAATQERMDEAFRICKHERLERVLGPIRMATPAFAGRAAISAQAAAGRFVRRSELYVRNALARLRN